MRIGVRKGKGSGGGIGRRRRNGDRRGWGGEIRFMFCFTFEPP